MSEKKILRSENMDQVVTKKGALAEGKRKGGEEGKNGFEKKNTLSIFTLEKRNEIKSLMYGEGGKIQDTWDKGKTGGIRVHWSPYIPYGILSGGNLC